MKFPAAPILLVAALLIPSLSPPVRAADLPSIGDTSSAYMSPEEEKRRGEAFMRHIRSTLHVVDDPEIVEYIESLGYRLVSSSGNPAQDFTFFVVQDPSVNAFAAPGGYIGVNTGLILATESEGELAAVLAHEIAHVSQRHLARAMEAASKMSIPAGAAVLAAVILGSQNPQLAEAAIAATAAGTLQNQINFTRANEKEADRVGIQTLAKAGFDPRSMPTFFERLQQATRFYDNSLPEYLRTHPVTHSRIADSMARAESLARRDEPGDPVYSAVRAKLRVMQSTPSESVTFFRAALEPSAAEDEQAIRYGLALALTAAGKYDEARRQLDLLAAGQPDNISHLLARGQLETATGNVKEAIRIYENGFRLFPHNYPLTIKYAEALILDQRPVQAKTLLEEHSRRKKSTLPLFKLLARADELSGNPARAHQSLAEYYYLSGSTAAAVEQLGIALRLADQSDGYQRARISARREQLQDELKQETSR